MATNEIINLLQKFEPTTLAALRSTAADLGVAETVLTKQLGGRRTDNKENYVEVRAAHDALQVAINSSPATLDKIRRKVNGLDQLRLLSEVLAAITGFFSASGVASDTGTRVLAGIACLSAIVSAIIPRLSTSDAGLRKSWGTHYSELVEAIAQADAVRRKLQVWIVKYDKNEPVTDPGDDVNAANAICKTILEKKLITVEPAGG